MTILIVLRLIFSSPSLQNKDPGGGVGSTSRGWRWVGLGKCKVGGVGSRSWILCSAVRTISLFLARFVYAIVINAVDRALLHFNGTFESLGCSGAPQGLDRKMGKQLRKQLF